MKYKLRAMWRIFVSNTYFLYVDGDMFASYPKKETKIANSATVCRRFAKLIDDTTDTKRDNMGNIKESAVYKEAK